MRRLRSSGKIPAVLYGHGKESVSLAINGRDVDAMMRHGSRIVELTGDLSESALLKEVQWNPVGSDVLHLDLARIDATELVEVALPVEIKGDAPGTKSGGILQQALHELQIRCPANELPEKLEVSVNHLELGQTISASDVELAK